MASAKFNRAHGVTAKWEGGWSNHAADPGGKTMYGVTEAVYHTFLKRKGRTIRPVRSITMAEAIEIYVTNYWNPVNGETLYPGVDLAVYDVAVNSGVSRAKKFLVASLDKNNDHAQTVRNICKRRLSFVRALATWRHFGKGWMNRITDVEAKGVAWAMVEMARTRAIPSPQKPQHEVADKLVTQSREAGNAASKQKTAAGGGAVGGSGGAVAAPTTVQDPTTLYIIVGLIVLAFVFAAFMAYRSRVNSSRAEAYAAAALETESEADAVG